MTLSAREIACEVSADIRIDDAYANLVLPRAISKHRLSPRDAADATSLTYGTARWRGLLDAVLNFVVDRSLEDIDGDVLDILRLGAFELLIDDAPPHVVNEWVNVAKKRTPRASGFVNATLRRVSRATADEWRDMLSDELTGDDRTVALTNHPAWIVQSFDNVLNEAEVDALILANNTPAVPTMIALPGLADIPTGSQRGALSPYAFRADQGNIALVPGMREGVVRVQDEGSQIAALLLAEAGVIVEGERWLDLCAGPGGKSALLAAVLSEHNGLLVANEPHEHRVELVRTALAPFGTGTQVVSVDGRTAVGELEIPFTRVLVDAPCSGLGALRRRPEARWRKREEDLVALTALQRELLNSAIDATAIGGFVAYVTCSPDQRETVDVVSAVMAERDDVAIIDTPLILERIAPSVDGARRGTAVQLWPHRHNTDAMFIQLLTRTR
jgi:16S rRNA (cytosine967-C5)-methyltransferase